MIWLLVAGAGVAAIALVVGWTAVRLGSRDPYAALGPVESHRQARADALDRPEE